MEHQNAIETLASERYLLGEMNEEEANDFEEHYFGCRECAGAVRDGSTFFDSGKAVVREREKEARKPALLFWFPSAAAAMLAVVVGIQAFNRPPAPKPEQITLVPLSSGTRSGATETVVPLRRGQTSGLSFDIPPEPPFTAYRWEIRDAAGKARAAHDVSADQAKDTILLSLSSSLPAGRYVLVIEGVRENGNRTEVTRFPFNAKRVE